MHKCLVAFLPILLTGCVAPSMYQWGSYEHDLYAAYKDPTNYEMLRLSDSPEIDVLTIESGAALGGLGEPATPPVAAAVANAVYILTGQRVRELPLKNYRFTAVPVEAQPV